MPKPELKLNKLKATYLILALCAIPAVGSYGWHVYTLFRDWQMNMPQPQIERITKDLRIHHAKTGQFPSTFIEINNLLWHTKPAPDLRRQWQASADKELLLLLYQSQRAHLRDLGFAHRAAAPLRYIVFSGSFAGMAAQLEGKSFG